MNEKIRAMLPTNSEKMTDQQKNEILAEIERVCNSVNHYLYLLPDEQIAWTDLDPLFHMQYHTMVTMIQFAEMNDCYEDYIYYNYIVGIYKKMDKKIIAL